jgi:hypothetical protein
MARCLLGGYPLQCHGSIFTCTTWTRLEELEDDWDALSGLDAEAAPRDTREVGGRDRGGTRRFGGAEAIDRKRADRRKQVFRASQARVSSAVTAERIHRLRRPHRVRRLVAARDLCNLHDALCEPGASEMTHAN